MPDADAFAPFIGLGNGLPFCVVNLDDIADGPWFNYAAYQALGPDYELSESAYETAVLSLYSGPYTQAELFQIYWSYLTTDTTATATQPKARVCPESFSHPVTSYGYRTVEGRREYYISSHFNTLYTPVAAGGLAGRLNSTGAQFGYYDGLATVTGRNLGNHLYVVKGRWPADEPPRNFFGFQSISSNHPSYAILNADVSIVVGSVVGLEGATPTAGKMYVATPHYVTTTTAHMWFVEVPASTAGNAILRGSLVSGYAILISSRVPDLAEFYELTGNEEDGYSCDSVGNGELDLDEVVYSYSSPAQTEDCPGVGNINKVVSWSDEHLVRFFGIVTAVATAEVGLDGFGDPIYEDYLTTNTDARQSFDARAVDTVQVFLGAGVLSLVNGGDFWTMPS